MFTPRFHGRQTYRMRGYDYAGCGCYFITVCTSRRGNRLGQIYNGEMRVNFGGAVLLDEWLKTSTLRSSVTLDAWVVMPDHFHALLWLDGESDNPSASFGYRVPGSLGSIVAGWKAACSSRIKAYRNQRGWPEIQLWQRNYFDHIVRDESELQLIRDYIQHNPANWNTDQHWP